jgi:hypothetical protein
MGPGEWIAVAAIVATIVLAIVSGLFWLLWEIRGTTARTDARTELLANQLADNDDEHGQLWETLGDHERRITTLETRQEE